MNTQLWKISFAAAVFAGSLTVVGPLPVIAVAAGPSPADVNATAAILIRTSAYEASCTGVLVAPDQVLTAGHCFQASERVSRGFLRRSKARVYVSVGARSGLKRTRTTVRALAWHPVVHGNIDLAVVDLPLGERPAPVAVATAPPPLLAPAWEVGYRDGGKRRSHKAPIRGLAACHYTKLTAALSLCAGKRFERNPPCAGDSGAPLFYEGRVAGILSGYNGSFDCGYRPFIYTRTDSLQARALIGPAAYL